MATWCDSHHLDDMIYSKCLFSEFKNEKRMAEIQLIVLLIRFGCLGNVCVCACKTFLIIRTEGRAETKTSEQTIENFGFVNAV